MKIVLMVVATILVFFSIDLLAANNVLPTYASGGSLQSEVQTKGKKITDMVILLVGIVSILSIIASAFYYSLLSNPEKGKQLLFGGMGGIMIASLSFGIAKLVA